MDAVTIACEIRRRLGDRAAHTHEVLAEIERVVAERPASARVRVAIEAEMLRLAEGSRAA